MKGTGGYLRNYSSPGSYGAKNYLSVGKYYGKMKVKRHIY